METGRWSKIEHPFGNQKLGLTAESDGYGGELVRFILSALAAVAGAVLLTIGLLQFSEAAAIDSITASGESQSDAPVMVLDEKVLSSHAGAQSIVISGDGPIVVAIGRTNDVHGWVGEAKHDAISVGPSVDGHPDQESLEFTVTGSETEVPDPLNSDLWMETIEGDGELTINTVVAPGYSMLIASDGAHPAPNKVAITWPFGGYAPLSGPLIVAGAVLLLVAGLLLWWALAGRRRAQRRAVVAPVAPAKPVDAAQREHAARDHEQWTAVRWDDELAESVVAAAADAQRDHEIDTELESAPDLDLSEPFQPRNAEEEPLPTSEIPIIRSAAPESNEQDAASDDAEPAVVDEPVLVDEPGAQDAAESATDSGAPVAEPEAEPEPETQAEAGPEPETQAEEPEPADSPESADKPEPVIETPAAPSSDDDESKWKRPRGRNRSQAPKRVFFVAPALLVGALTLAGCAPQYWPQSWTGTEIAPTGTPTSEADAAIIDEGAHYPVLSVERADKIIADAGARAKEADKNRDAKLLEPRFTGDALAERKALYKAQSADGELPGPVPFPTGKVAYLIPDATQEWPRTAFAVVNATSDGSADAVPFGAMLVQQSPREGYRITSLVQFEPGVQLPDAAPVEIGATPLPELADGLAQNPDKIAAAYADIIAKGDKSEHAKNFTAEHDALRKQVNDDYRKSERDGLDAEVAKLDFSYAATDSEPVGVTALDGGAIVAVSIHETETLSAVNDRSRISVAGRTAALAGTDTSEFGFERVYTDQVLFYIPPKATGGKVSFLGTSQAMTSARQLTKDEVNTNG